MTMQMCTLAMPVCAATRAEAEDKMALIRQLPLEIDALSLLAEALNFDFAAKGLDEPLTTEELASFSGLQSIRDRVVRDAASRTRRVREFLQYSGRGRVDDAIVGGPREVADVLEERFAARACDGFVIAATHVPGAYADFVRPRRARAAAARAVSTPTTRPDAAREPRPGPRP